MPNLLSSGVDILIVYDESIIVKRLSTLLTALGCSVFACTHSESVLEIIERNNFSLIITDLKMRKVDGIRILEEARLKNKGIKVIVMTGFGNGESITKIIRKGLTERIHKPFKTEELQSAITNILHPRNGSQTLVRR